MTDSQSSLSTSQPKLHSFIHFQIPLFIIVRPIGQSNALLRRSKRHFFFSFNGEAIRAFRLSWKDQKRRRNKKKTGSILLTLSFTISTKTKRWTAKLKLQLSKGLFLPLYFAFFIGQCASLSFPSCWHVAKLVFLFISLLPNKQLILMYKI